MARHSCCWLMAPSTTSHLISNILDVQGLAVFSQVPGHRNHFSVLLLHPHLTGKHSRVSSLLDGQEEHILKEKVVRFLAGVLFHRQLKDHCDDTTFTAADVESFRKPLSAVYGVMYVENRRWLVCINRVLIGFSAHMSMCKTQPVLMDCNRETTRT